MARMGVNPMQGLGANPMGGFLGQQQLPPQVAALAPTRQSLEAQVSVIVAAKLKSFLSLSFAVFFSVATARGDGIRQPGSKHTGADSYWRQR